MNDLPDGFEDASTDMQKHILKSYQSEELAAEIASELGMDEPRSGQLTKRHKVAILLTLR
jgi:transcriptional regulator GlxA family with amidase domain